MKALLISDASADGFSSLQLGVYKDNPVRGLYEKAGFRHAHAEGEYLYYSLPQLLQTLGPEMQKSMRAPGLAFQIGLANASVQADQLCVNRPQHFRACGPYPVLLNSPR